MLLFIVLLVNVAFGAGKTVNISFLVDSLPTFSMCIFTEKNISIYPDVKIRRGNKWHTGIQNSCQLLKNIVIAF